MEDDIQSESWRSTVKRNNYLETGEGRIEEPIMDGRRVARAPALLLLLVAVLPAAVAAPGTGTFRATGTVLFDSTGTTSGDALAFLIPRATDTRLSLEAPVADVCRFEAKYREISVAGSTFWLPPERKHACYPLHDLKLTVTSTGAWDGSYIAVDATDADLYLEFPAGVEVEPRNSSTLASEAADAAFVSSEDAPPEDFYYHRQLSEPHLYISVSASGSLSGAASLKILGPSLKLEAQENTTTYTTGKFGTQDITSEQTFRWFFVTFDRGVVAFESNQPSDFAIEAGHVSGTGRFSLTADGSLEAGGARYEVSHPAPIQLLGDLTLTLQPLDRSGMALVGVGGDLRSTNLLASGARVPAPLDSGFGWPVVLAAAVIGASAIGALWRVRTTTTPFEEALQRARDAQEAGNYERALLWIRRVRRRKPATGQYAMDEAFYLSKLQRFEAAFAVYAEASRLTASSEPEMAAARLARTAGYPTETVEMWLKRALEKEPDLLASIEHEFPELVDRESWTSLSSRAAEKQRGPISR